MKNTKQWTCVFKDTVSGVLEAVVLTIDTTSSVEDRRKYAQAIRPDKTYVTMYDPSTMLASGSKSLDAGTLF